MLEGKGLSVPYADRDTGVHFPCLEIGLDEELHNHFTATIAKGVFARIGDVLQINVGDYFTRGRRGWVRLHEKDGIAAAGAAHG